jgi:hypothetical protein
MIKNAEVAASISELLTKTFNALGESIIDVNDRCSPEEAQAYRQKVGDIFYIITFGVLEPLYKEHPELKPPDWT